MVKFPKSFPCSVQWCQKPAGQNKTKTLLATSSSSYYCSINMFAFPANSSKEVSQHTASPFPLLIPSWTSSNITHIIPLVSRSMVHSQSLPSSTSEQPQERYYSASWAPLLLPFSALLHLVLLGAFSSKLRVPGLSPLPYSLLSTLPHW